MKLFHSANVILLIVVFVLKNIQMMNMNDLIKKKEGNENEKRKNNKMQLQQNL